MLILCKILIIAEDVLNAPQALWSSYDGSHLLYATFNDSEVGILNFPWFSTGTVLTGSKTTKRAPSFPGSRTVRYPTVSQTIKIKRILMSMNKKHYYNKTERVVCICSRDHPIPKFNFGF